jgi:threonine dehydratase
VDAADQPAAADGHDDDVGVGRIVLDLERGEPTPVTPASVADGLNAPFAGELPLAILRDVERVLVSEEEIENAFRLLYERAKLACEPAGAAAAAAWLSGRIEAQNPVLVVSGGNVATRTASAILARP